jgi:hypothetical protein
MNGPPESPTTQDPTLRTLVERGLASARARQAACATIEPPSGRPKPAVERVVAPLRALGLASDRGCVETNLARKGLWRSGSARSAADGELDEAGGRHVPSTLEAMAADLGSRKGGGAGAELARALRKLGA